MDKAGHVHQETVRFWNANPCDANPDITRRSRYRYSKEPWLEPLIRDIARHCTVVEVGCGQGTDAITCCRQMGTGSLYLGLDASRESLSNARRSAMASPELQVIPVFLEGKAEELPFRSGSIPCVVSIGVLHHLHDERKAIAEIRRVLFPGGVACIALYRKWAPKLVVARCLRRIAHMVGVSFGLTGNPDEKAGGKSGVSQHLGTMLRECFGAPVLKSYTCREIRELFRGFDIRSITAVGAGVPAIGGVSVSGRRTTVLGSYWLVRVEKGRMAE